MAEPIDRPFSESAGPGGVYSKAWEDAGGDGDKYVALLLERGLIPAHAARSVLAAPPAPPARLKSGEDLRDDALERVRRAAPAHWLARAMEAVFTVAQRLDYMTTDDVWDRLRGWQVPVPVEPRAMGVVMRDAAKEGWIKPTGQFRKTVRPQAHAGDVRVWKSGLR